MEEIRLTIHWMFEESIVKSLTNNDEKFLYLWNKR